MGRVTKYKPLYPWLGGVNTSVDPVILDPQKLTIADNIIFTNSGSRKKRGGQARFNSVKAAGASTASFVYMADYWANVSNAKREYFVAVSDNGKVFRTTPAAASWSSFSTLTLSITHGGISHTVQEEDLILGIQGSGVPKIWNNQSTSVNLVNMTSATTSALPFTSAWIVTSFLERAWFAGDPAFPDRVYVSKAGTYNNFTTGTAGNAITLEVGNGDGDSGGITAIFPGTAGDRVMYVGKRNHIYRIDCSDLDEDNWKVTRLSNQIGVVNPSVVKTIDETDILFASDRGVHSLGQVINGTAIRDGEFLSFPIQPDYRDVISSANRTKMSATWNPSLNCYLLSCKRTGMTDFETVYGFNVELKEWFRWTAVPCNFLMTRLNTTTGAYDLYGCGTTGYINKLNQTALNDFNAPIVTRIKTSFITPDDIPFSENQFTNLACIFRAHENSTFRVYYSVDGLISKSVTFEQRRAGSNILGTTLLGPDFILGEIQAIKPVWNHLAIDEGNSLQLTFEQDGLNEDFELFGIIIEYQGDEEGQNAFRNPLYS